jgi:hypothetical protein
LSHRNLKSGNTSQVVNLIDYARRFIVSVNFYSGDGRLRYFIEDLAKSKGEYNSSE